MIISKLEAIDRFGSTYSVLSMKKLDMSPLLAKLMNSCGNQVMCQEPGGSIDEFRTSPAAGAQKLTSICHDESTWWEKRFLFPLLTDHSIHQSVTRTLTVIVTI